MATVEKWTKRRRKLKPVILIGRRALQTEPKYFEHYAPPANIDTWSAGHQRGETDYLALIRKAVEYQSKKSAFCISNGDAVWVVADGDVNYNTPPDPIAAKDKLLSKSTKWLMRRGIHIALSNPLF